MAKGKGKKGQKGSAGAAQSHLRARISYLHKASAYILSANSQTTRPQNIKESPGVDQSSRNEDTDKAGPNASPKSSPTPSGIASQSRPETAKLPRQYLAQMRGVSLKSQLRLSQDIKRSVCKRCDILLVPGSNCTEEIENLSRGKKKPWADVRVVRCTSCGTTKRFPQTSKRSSRLSERSRKKPETSVPASAASTWNVSPSLSNELITTAWTSCGNTPSLPLNW